jgi:succinate dehydrogenase / fumarate reductase, membrane anchor subunit
MTDFRTPLAKVRGMGSAKEGTTHFWRQRLTAIANVPLLLFFIGLIVYLNGASHAETVAVLSNPLVALAMIAVLISGLYHMRLGMDDIILDYAHSEGMKFALVILNNFFCLGVGLMAVYSLLKLSFGG